MFENRLEITAELETLSPLHIGTGASIVVPGLQKTTDDADNGEARVAAVLRDHRGKPCIPGATIKGLLRRQCGDDEALANTLFGTARGAEGESIGRLTAHAAHLKALPSLNEADLPPHLKLEREGGVYIHARVRLDPATGVPKDGNLYHAEAVVPGARFALSLSLDLSRGGDEDALVEALATGLARLAAAQGVPCGRGQSQGQGRLVLNVDTLKATHRRLAPDGTLGREDASQRLRKAVAAAAGAGPAGIEPLGEVTLVCHGPYLTVGARKSPSTAKSDDEAERQKVEALRLGPRHPLVVGSGVMGVLRNRARWLTGLRALRDGGEVPETLDDPDGQFSRIERMSGPVDRLFGLTGWRGRLMLTALEVLDGGQQEDLTSVALDPFSGAPLDGALFTTRAFTGVRIRVALGLRHAGKDYPLDAAQADNALAEDILSDLKKNGIMLGHGTTRGFGWFVCEDA